MSNVELLRKMRNAAINRHHLTMLSLKDQRGICELGWTMFEMLEDIERACITALQNNAPLSAEGLLAYLRDNKVSTEKETQDAPADQHPAEEAARQG